MSPPPPASLALRVRDLLHQARRVYAGGPAAPALDAAAARLDEPLRIAIAGRLKAGKSTLLNGLVGQDLAATDAGECTRVVTWYRDGHTYRVTAHPRSGPPRQLPPGPAGGLIDGDLGGLRAADLDRLVVDWPSPALASMTLIDTPGMDSLSTELGQRTRSALEESDGGPGAADAVVYLMRHVHDTDVLFLETFRGDDRDRRPINTLGVLGRADEIGHGRPDALESAERVADRYRRDPRIRALCQTVLPVAGLLAVTAATLREDEFRTVVALADLPEAEGRSLLLSAQRFVTRDLGAAGPTTAHRTALLDRFGIFGVRLAVSLRRGGEAPTARALAHELHARSGLESLRAALAGRFAGRADVLKARTALVAIDAVLRRHPLPAAHDLRRDLEVVTAGAHEFAEIRLLDVLASGSLMLTDPEREAAARLLGGEGADPCARLGLEPGTPAPVVGRAATAALARWQQRAESPVSARDVREASRVLVRTCEGLVVATFTAARPAPPVAVR